MAVRPAVSGLTVRPAALADADEIAPLLGDLGYPSTADQVRRRLEALRDAGESLFVAEWDGEVAGLAGMRIERLIEDDEPACRLTALAVAERHRRRGVGAALVRHVEEQARAAGCARIVLTSGNHREGAHAFYRRLGYEATGQRFIKTLAR